MYRIDRYEILKRCAITTGLLPLCIVFLYVLNPSKGCYRGIRSGWLAIPSAVITAVVWPVAIFPTKTNWPRVTKSQDQADGPRRTLILDQTLYNCPRTQGSYQHSEQDAPALPCQGEVSPQSNRYLLPPRHGPLLSPLWINSKWRMQP